MAWRAVAVALAVPILGACSAIVAPEDLPIRCTETDACPKGTVCEDEVCVPDDIEPEPDAGCVPNDEPELCNGLDDDCDREIDEGHDSDGDGVTWCNGGQASGRDCNDQDPLETPGKPEVCDGHDNDCNGSTDDDVCDAGLVCEPSSGDCVARDCRDEGCGVGFACEERDGTWTCVASKNPDDCRDGSLICGAGEVCNQQNGECVPVGELGETCFGDADCRDLLCASTASLRMADGERFCARECCVTADCPDGFVCWQPGSGWSACVSRAQLGLGDGSAAEGAGCSTDSDCASGSCVGSSCAEPCCEGSDCGGGSCTFAFDEASPDSVKQVCGQGGGGDVGALCEADDECSSLLCVPDFLADYCSAPCCGSEACGWGMVCTMGTFVDMPSSPSTRVCALDLVWLDPGYGDGRPGDDCSSDDDCRSDRCGESGECVDACCSDADCPQGTSCRMSPVLDGGELLCMRDP